MTNVTIDGTDYDLDEMSDNAKAQLESLVAVDKKLVTSNKIWPYTNR